MIMDIIGAAVILIAVPVVVVAISALLIYGPSWLILKWLERL